MAEVGLELNDKIIFKLTRQISKGEADRDERCQLLSVYVWLLRFENDRTISLIPPCKEFGFWRYQLNAWAIFCCQGKLTTGEPNDCGLTFIESHCGSYIEYMTKEKAYNSNLINGRQC